MRIYLFGAAILALAGCVESVPTMYSYRPNTTIGQKEDDRLSCKIEAANRVPQNTQIGTTPVYTTPVYTTPVTTSCYGYTCTTSGGQVYGGQVYGGDVYTYDANSELRGDAYAQCMRRKGYQWTSTRTCSTEETPDGLTISTGDKLRPVTPNSCIAQVSEGLGIPVEVAKPQ